MKIAIKEEERYPDFVIAPFEETKMPSFVLDVDEETLQRWNIAMDEYDKVQNEIEAYRVMHENA